MAKRSTVEKLPKSVKSWLDGALIEGNFSGYEALSEELGKRGCSISKSAIHRYGKAFQDRLESIKRRTEMAKMLNEHVSDDEGDMSDALTRLMQDRLFSLLEEIDAVEMGVGDIAKLTRAISDLGRSTISHKRFRQEVKEKAEAAAKSVRDIGDKAGISDDTLRIIEEQILGISR